MTKSTPKSPLAVYIHWPFCKSKCPYCDFNSHVREAVDQGRWKKALLSELSYMHSRLPDREVTSIFFGGGTPSLMPPETAAGLIDQVHALWPTSPNIEITLEANPTSVEAHTFPDFKHAGINRVSLGVQSLDDKELKFLGRGHSMNEALGAIDLARKSFARYSFDLIYARPNQTVSAWEKELSQALMLTGGHLSLYQLTIEENTAFHHAYKKGEFALPDEETSEQLYHLTESMAAAHGLYAYEVSNYARAGEESRHNLSYWLGDDYIGVGPGAHGRLTVDGKRIATSTLKSPERWLENAEKNTHAIEVWQDIDSATEIEERVMMGLRVKQGIEFADFKRRTGRDLLSHINVKKQAMFMEQGLLENNPQRLQTTLKGRLVLNQLTSELLS